MNTKRYFTNAEMEKIIIEIQNERRKISIFNVMNKTFEEMTKNQWGTDRNIKLLEDEINRRLRSLTGIDLNVELEMKGFTEIHVKDIFIMF